MRFNDSVKTIIKTVGYDTFEAYNPIADDRFCDKLSIGSVMEGVYEDQV